MKVGSLVVFIGGRATDRVVWMPTVDEVYTIRDIRQSPNYGPYALLEEGVVGVHTDGNEYGIALGCLREIQPPEEGKELIKEVNQIEEPA